jgi:hypothetical protein
MPKTVEVEELPFVVLLAQEIALTPPHVFLGVLLGCLQPSSPGVGHVRPEHLRDVGSRWHSEDGCLGRLRGNMLSEQLG